MANEFLTKIAPLQVAAGAAVFCEGILQMGLPFLVAFLALPRLGLPVTMVKSFREVTAVLIVLATRYVACRRQTW
jgi:hypothetical protein